VQIAYSETEGYVPVTSKAQESAEYQDYLSRSGEDTDTHYAVKINAASLLLSHMDDTFITPVFNGSTSLREAAGQLIEDTVKSVRRKQTVDDAYIEMLYSDTTSLYRLDQINSFGASGEMLDLGPLPTTSVVLLSVLLGTWILILIGVIVSKIKKYRNFK
jgi:multiple sugar transport system substrate-binding protein